MVYCSIIAKDEQESAMTDKRETQRISREAVADQLRRCRELTDKPFGVNVAMFSPIVKEIIDLVCEENVALVTTGGGSPAPYMEQLKAAGATRFAESFEELEKILFGEENFV